MAGPQVDDGEEGLQIWREAANVPSNKCTADTGCYRVEVAALE
jgi:hypothetical protein